MFLLLFLHFVVTCCNLSSFLAAAGETTYGSNRLSWFLSVNKMDSQPVIGGCVYMRHMFFMPIISCRITKAYN